MSALKPSRWEALAKKSVYKKNDRGDTIVISLEGTSQERQLSDDDFIKISPFLKSVRLRIECIEGSVITVTKSAIVSSANLAGRGRYRAWGTRKGQASLSRREGPVQFLWRCRGSSPLQHADRVARIRHSGRSRHPPMEERAGRWGRVRCCGPRRRVVRRGLGAVLGRRGTQWRACVCLRVSIYGRSQPSPKITPGPNRLRPPPRINARTCPRQSLGAVRRTHGDVHFRAEVSASASNALHTPALLSRVPNSSRPCIFARRRSALRPSARPGAPLPCPGRFLTGAILSQKTVPNQIRDAAA